MPRSLEIALWVARSSSSIADRTLERNSILVNVVYLAAVALSHVYVGASALFT